MGSTVGAGYLRLKKTPPVTVDLVVSTGVATEIDTSLDMVSHLSLFSYAAFHMTWASDASEAATRIANDSTRLSRPAGNLEIDVSGNTQKLYVRSQGAAVVAGLSYFMSEPD